MLGSGSIARNVISGLVTPPSISVVKSNSRTQSTSKPCFIDSGDSGTPIIVYQKELDIINW